MSLNPQPIPPVPEETILVAQDNWRRKKSSAPECLVNIPDNFSNSFLNTHAKESLDPMPLSTNLSP